MDADVVRSEIRYRFSRSSGPGGQHAQKSSTRVEALFDVEPSAGLSDAEKGRVVALIGSDIRAIAQDERSQLRNRDLATERIVEQVAAAAKPVTKRRPTKPSKAAKERRLEGKRIRSEVKRLRESPPD